MSVSASRNEVTHPDDVLHQPILMQAFGKPSTIELSLTLKHPVDFYLPKDDELDHKIADLLDDIKHYEAKLSKKKQRLDELQKKKRERERLMSMGTIKDQMEPTIETKEFKQITKETTEAILDTDPSLRFHPIPHIEVVKEAFELAPRIEQPNGTDPSAGLCIDLNEPEDSNQPPEHIQDQSENKSPEHIQDKSYIHEDKNVEKDEKEETTVQDEVIEDEIIQDEVIEDEPHEAEDEPIEDRSSDRPHNIEIVNIDDDDQIVANGATPDIEPKKRRKRKIRTGTKIEAYMQVLRDHPQQTMHAKDVHTILKKRGGPLPETSRGDAPCYITGIISARITNYIERNSGHFEILAPGTFRYKGKSASPSSSQSEPSITLLTTPPPPSLDSEEPSPSHPPPPSVSPAEPETDEPIARSTRSHTKNRISPTKKTKKEPFLRYDNEPDKDFD
eukprot:TRINITY_DN5123_c0_g1_i3.p2 TRINITY_DN5123_c0_g1~~TRINITY_DN5123_c0_g1_i3.p2  ORF type:complete len:446 (-),score=116.13 TRINITY_DN5123_c0_g1_i3:72-1409(-)